MDEYLNNRQREIFHNLLANPADTGSAYVNSLQELVRSHPQSGLFRALYARALNDKSPAAAGAYFDSRALHKLYHQPDTLLEVDSAQVVVQPATVSPKPVEARQQPVETSQSIAEPVTEPVATNNQTLQGQPLDFPEVLNVSWMPNADDVIKEETVTPANVLAEPVAPQEALIEPKPSPAPVVNAEPVTPSTHTAETKIEEEVFDEITGIDDIEFVQNPADLSEAPVAADESLIEQEPATPAAEPQPVRDEAEKLILGNIAATDYFVFDKAFGDSRKTNTETPPAVPEPAEQPPFVAMPHEAAPVSEPAAAENTQQDVSKYHDEKMPYTFMWWLDKTRKEHGSLYQPYVKAPVNNPAPAPAAKPVNDALQQQYFENIFHISSVDDLNSDAAAQTVEFDMQSKEDRIIQRFIAEDPHIHPPVGEKLDTENKARKSSEDNNEMVTETLARIYTDQMLYPKAIATYKKLMLKFPEKSRYFASRIENLEKKTN